MPGIREIRHMPYTAEQMFDLVADVARYAEFLPWIVGTRVRSNSETEMTADLLVGFNALREKFTSRVEKVRPSEIRVHYDHPLHLVAIDRLVVRHLFHETEGVLAAGVAGALGNHAVGLPRAECWRLRPKLRRCPRCPAAPSCG